MLSACLVSMVCQGPRVPLASQDLKALKETKDPLVIPEHPELLGQTVNQGPQDL